MRAASAWSAAPTWLLLLACATLRPAGAPTAAVAATAGDGWRTDPVWYDGQAEVCVYDATRTIYDRVRSYPATAYTNKENADPRTTCKSATDKGVEVFKHHWSERVPTENYDYRFSTMTYTRTSDMQSWKLSASTQEDCGASFKEAWRDGEKLSWWESVYFPGGGRRTGTISSPTSGGEEIFFDALTLRLRDYDFERHADLVLAVVPMQKDTHSVPFAAEARTVRFAGTSEVDVPYGKVRVHELDLVDSKGAVEARYWFAAESKAPLLHTLVRFEGPQGITYALRSLERKAYWKRG